MQYAECGSYTNDDKIISLCNLIDTEYLPSKRRTYVFCHVTEVIHKHNDCILYIYMYVSRFTSIDISIFIR